MAQFKRNSGMSLVELMVVIGLMGIVMAGMGSFFSQILRVQEQTRLISNIQILKSTLIRNIESDAAWSNTVNQAINTSMACLRVSDSTLCNHNDSSNFNIFDAANGLAFNSLVATSGFTKDGVVCNAFTTAGNDQCPIRWDLRWTVVCPGAVATCKTPSIQVLGTFSYEPSDSLLRVNPSNFHVNMIRGEGSLYKPFKVESIDTTASGGGACTPDTWVERTITTETYDIGENVTIASGTEFTIEAGTYHCDVSASVFGLGNYRIRLNDKTSSLTYNIGQGLAVDGSPGILFGKVVITLTGASTFTVETFCERNNSSNASFDMGLPIPTSFGGSPTYTGGTSYTSVACVRLS